MNRSVDRSFQLLGLLQENKSGLTLKEITDLLDIPKTSAFDIIKTLLDLDVISQPDEDVKRYKIGLRLFELGSSYILDKSIYNVGNKHLKQIAEKLNKTAFLGVMRNDKVIYIQKYEPNVSIRTSCNVGSNADLYCTALGKTLLAYSPKKLQEELVANLKFIKYQKNTIDTVQALNKELELTYQRGYAIDDNELEQGIFCIAAPIFDNNHQVIAAISVSGIQNDLMDVDFEGQLLIETANNISKELGYIRR